MKRAALVAGVSFAALLMAGSAQVRAAANPEIWWANSRAVTAYDLPARRSVKARSRASEKAERQGWTCGRQDAADPVRAAAHHRLDRQAARDAVRQRPAGRQHRDFLRHRRPSDADGRVHRHPEEPPSRLQSLQRVDALHAAHHLVGLGAAPRPLPGYPASHGCVRLTESFAQLLWKTTKMGARVIVTRPEVAPLEFEHARLFVPKPKMVAAPPRRRPPPRCRAVSVAQPEPATTSTVDQGQDRGRDVRCGRGGRRRRLEGGGHSGRDRACRPARRSRAADQAVPTADGTAARANRPRPDPPKRSRRGKAATAARRLKPNRRRNLQSHRRGKARRRPDRTRTLRRRRSSSTNAPRPCPRPSCRRPTAGRSRCSSASRNASSTSARAGSRCSRRR